jgi:hypothetical protein
MLHNHPLTRNPAHPRIQICHHCHRPLVLIDYHEKLLKDCLSCNLWGRPGGRAWTRLPSHELRTLEGSMRSKSAEVVHTQEKS